MKTSSAKSKGRRLQQLVAGKVLETFEDLTTHDVKSTTMGETGIDIQLSAAARKKFPYALEIRNREKFNIWQAMDDARRHAEKEGLTPLVVFARNRTRPCAVLDLEDFFALLKKIDTLSSPCVHDLVTEFSDTDGWYERQQDTDGRTVLVERPPNTRQDS